MNQLSVAELAYIAGIVDGEGSICVYRSKKKISTVVSTPRVKPGWKTRNTRIFEVVNA